MKNKLNYYRKLELIFRKYFPKRYKHRNFIRQIFKNKNGIELGGPSQIFSNKGFLPIYNAINSLDNVNFKSQTLWEKEITDLGIFKIENIKGTQYIREASELTGIKDNTYYFLLSSHNIEHLANPLKALKEWKRVVKPNGYFLFIVPNKFATFDHKRPITSIEHIIFDYKNNTDEKDQTHINEILELYDLEKDPITENIDQLKKLMLNNFENRCAHHHVFDLNLLKELAISSNIEIVHTSVFSKMHLILLGRNIK